MKSKLSFFLEQRKAEIREFETQLDRQRQLQVIIERNYIAICRKFVTISHQPRKFLIHVFAESKPRIQWRSDQFFLCVDYGIILRSRCTIPLISQVAFLQVIDQTNRHGKNPSNMIHSSKARIRPSYPGIPVATELRTTNESEFVRVFGSSCLVGL